MEFRVLGPLEVVRGGSALDLGGHKPRALLARLLMQPGRVVSVDTLLDDLWAGDPPAQGKPSLHAYISVLRRQLEPDRAPGAPSTVIVTRGNGYALEAQPDLIDAVRFTSAADRVRAAAQAGRAREALDVAGSALELWRGEPYADLGGADFVQPERTRLVETRIALVEARADAALSLGQHDALVAELRALVAEHPLRERLRGQLMLALYRAGRQADALAEYTAARELLADELGVDPGPELQRRYELVLRQDPSLSWDAPAETVTVPVSRTAPATTLVGRDREVALGAAAVGSVVAGAGRLVLIGGEAGIGKTAVAEDIARQAVAAGADAHWGRCFEGDAAPAYWPWVQVLRDTAAALEPVTLRSAVGAGAADIAQLVPELREQLGAIDPPPLLDPAAARARLLDSVARFLVRAATHRPLAVILDDLHWADLPSLDLLRLLVDQIPAQRLLVVATYRDVDADRGPALSSALGAMSRLRHVVRMSLCGLDAEQVGTLAASYLDQPLSDAAAARLHERTGGNPFFLTELVRLLAETGTSTTVPEAVRDVLIRRVSALPADAVEALEVAAVLGAEVPVAAAAAILDVPVPVLLDRLEPAVEGGLVEPTDTRLVSYRFAHSLLRDAVYEGLSPVRRARLHGMAGTVLERAGGAESVGEVARHYESAAALGYAERAVDAALLAAEQALRVTGYELAQTHLQQALRVLDAHLDDPRRELVAQARLATLLLMTSGYASPEMRTAAERVRVLAREVGDVPEVVGVLLAMWTDACVRGDEQLALTLADEMLAEADKTGDEAMQAAGLHALGVTRWQWGHIAAAVPDLRAALAIVDRLPLPELMMRGVGGLVVQTRCFLGMSELRFDRRELAREMVLDAVQVADQIGTPFDVMFANEVLGHLSIELRDVESAERVERRTAELAGRFPLLDELALLSVGWLQARRGDVDGGVATMRAARSRLDEMQFLTLRCLHGLFIGIALYDAGRYADALEVVDAGLQFADETGDRYGLPALLRLRADLLVALGRDDEAAEWRSRSDAEFLLQGETTEPEVPVQRRVASRV